MAQPRYEGWFSASPTLEHEKNVLIEGNDDEQMYSG